MREVTYLGGWMSAGGGCEAAVTTKLGYDWLSFDKLMHIKRFSLKIKSTLDKNYV